MKELLALGFCQVIILATCLFIGKTTIYSHGVAKLDRPKLALIIWVVLQILVIYLHRSYFLRA